MMISLQSWLLIWQLVGDKIACECESFQQFQIACGRAISVTYLVFLVMLAWLLSRITLWELCIIFCSSRIPEISDYLIYPLLETHRVIPNFAVASFVVGLSSLVCCLTLKKSEEYPSRVASRDVTRSISDNFNPECNVIISTLSLSNMVSNLRCWMP